MKSLLKIKDNSFYSIDIFDKHKIILDSIINSNISALEKKGIFVFPESLKHIEDLEDSQFLLQNINNQIKTSNLMGYIGMDKQKINIESRFSSDDEDYFMKYMLEKVFEIPNILNLNTTMNNSHQHINLLIYMFPYYLKDAMKSGLFKTYINQEYNDSNVKGKIDIVKHIKSNIPFTGNVAYIQREFSFDNYLTQLIRHTIEYIANRVEGRSVLNNVKKELSIIREETQEFNPQSKVWIVNQNRKYPINHPYYHKYYSLQKLCLAILEEKMHNLGDGRNKIHGVIFDGSWLWEEYVYKLIQDEYHHPSNKNGKGAQQLFTSKNREMGKIYPDFISVSEEKRIIADAKYKPYTNIGNKDYLQLLAYMFRFDSKIGFYAYPNSILDKDSLIYLNKGSTYESNVMSREDIFIVKEGIEIPHRVSSYTEFKIRMSTNEKDFLARIKNLSI